METEDFEPTPKPKDPLQRLFVAVPLWGEFRQSALPKWKALRDQGLNLRWVQPEHWHLTLKFLGDVPESSVPELRRSLGERLAEQEPFGIELGGLGGFPRVSRLRVLWVGVREGRESLAALAKAVHLGCVMAGQPGDKKPFQGHLTLARAQREAISVNVPQQLYADSWGSQRIESITLVKSTLSPQAPIYEPLCELPLQGMPPESP